MDGVIIATPTHLHAAHGMEAAARGWPMLIEKPVAGNLEQARELAKVLQDRKLRRSWAITAAIIGWFNS